LKTGRGYQLKTIITICAVILAVLAGAVYFMQPTNYSVAGLFVVTILGEGALAAIMVHTLRAEDKKNKNNKQ
jgi:hypothetical protein